MEHYKVSFNLVNGVFGDVYLLVNKQSDIEPMLNNLFRSPVKSFSYVFLCVTSKI